MEKKVLLGSGCYCCVCPSCEMYPRIKSFQYIHSQFHCSALQPAAKCALKLLTLHIELEHQTHFVSGVDLTLVIAIVLLQHRVNLEDPGVGSGFYAHTSV